ncbi:DsbA family protein [Nocardioides ferulae]|uniref:DsbA family protein n=1 Tax=Nocardioides ferulae TaxID=2340821 RepID=UPI000EB27965|nr:thioredoxin domain-containing protein [Nocardioides ferulae]
MSKKTERDSRSQRAAAAIAEQQRKERQRQSIIVGAIVAVLLVIVVGMFMVLSGQDTSGDEADSVPAGVTDDYGVVIGEEDAPLEVVIYEDFQCGVCAQFHAAMGDQLNAAAEDGRARVEFRVVSFLNDYSDRAHNAAMVVLDTAGEEAFLEFHDVLLENQPQGGDGLSDDQLVDYAVEAGADEDAVRSGIEDMTFEQWTVNATDEMSKNDVSGTPTVFIDGEVTENPADAVAQLQEALGE